VQVQNAGVHEKQKQQGVGQQGGQEQQRVQIVTVPSSTSGGHSQQGKNGARPGANARGRIERAGKPVGAGKRGGGRVAVVSTVMLLHVHSCHPSSFFGYISLPSHLLLAVDFSILNCVLPGIIPTIGLLHIEQMF
jgi:hypothetical protein